MEIGKELFKQAKELRKKGKFTARQNPSELDKGNEEQERS